MVSVRVVSLYMKHWENANISLMEGVVVRDMDILARFNVLFIIMCKLFVPIMFLLVGVSVVFTYYRKYYEDKIKWIVKDYWIAFSFSGFFLFITFIIGSKFSDIVFEVEEMAKYLSVNSFQDLFKYIIQIPHVFWWFISSFIVGLIMMYYDARRLDRNYEIMKKKRNNDKRMDNYKDVDLDYDKNIFVCGKNGAGKGVAISNFIKRHILNNEFVVVIDGKGDTGEHSLYDIVTRLCLEHNRKIYIINQTLPDETDCYNPFIGCNATQIKDMLINMSEWSEEHFKALAGEYYQSVAQFMLDIEMDISFRTLTKYSIASNWEKALKTYKNYIGQEATQEYIGVIERCGDAVAGTISRFSTISKGEGRKIFGETHPFNIRQAYDENAVVLVMLNRLEYTDFARALGKLVMNDIKNVLGKATQRKEEHKKFLCVYDELSVYFCDMIVDIVNKSRSLGGTNILSTQSIADMDVVDENLRRQVINNMHGFFLLKQADDKSAEALSSAIGTKRATQLTSKTDSFGKTGEGTIKIVDEFIINPNQLKTLPLEVGYWIDTMKEDFIVKRVRMPYVDVSNLKQFDFGEYHK